MNGKFLEYVHASLRVSYQKFTILRSNCGVIGLWLNKNYELIHTQLTILAIKINSFQKPSSLGENSQL